jgi:hypothetical protein
MGDTTSSVSAPTVSQRTHYGNERKAWCKGTEITEEPLYQTTWHLYMLVILIFTAIATSNTSSVNIVLKK